MYRRRKTDRRTKHLKTLCIAVFYETTDFKLQTFCVRAYIYLHYLHNSIVFSYKSMCQNEHTRVHKRQKIYNGFVSTSFQGFDQKMTMTKVMAEVHMGALVEVMLDLTPLEDLFAK